MSKGTKALVDTLINAGVDTCFTNPGTSKYIFAALDGMPTPLAKEKISLRPDWAALLSY